MGDSWNFVTSRIVPGEYYKDCSAFLVSSVWGVFTTIQPFRQWFVRGGSSVYAPAIVVRGTSSSPCWRTSRKYIVFIQIWCVAWPLITIVWWYADFATNVWGILLLPWRVIVSYNKARVCSQRCRGWAWNKIVEKPLWLRGLLCWSIVIPGVTHARLHKQHRKYYSMRHGVFCRDGAMAMDRQ